jgi:anti-sigma B factor antagonist
MIITSPSAAVSTHAGQMPIVDLTCGEHLDAGVTLSLRETTVRAAADGPVLVLLDVSGIRAIDASGVVGLLEVLRQVRSRGGDLRLHGTSRALNDAGLQGHLGHVARIYRDRQEAAVGGAGPQPSHRRRGTRGIRNRLSQRLRSLAWPRA